MAKGFTVKAATPKGSDNGPTEEELVQRGRELLKGKTVVFCLPGRGVSYVYLKNFVQLCLILYRIRHKFRFHKITHQW